MQDAPVGVLSSFGPGVCYSAARMQFSELGLIPPLATAVAKQGYLEPTPIQARRSLTSSRARICSGSPRPAPARRRRSRCPSCSGSCAPAGDRVHGRPIRVPGPHARRASWRRRSARASPTYGQHLPLRHTVIFGGVGQNAAGAGAPPRRRHPRRHARAACSTSSSQGLVDLAALEIFVLDEADRMLDMGFIHDVSARSSRCCRSERQTLFFSATMPREAPGARRSAARRIPRRVAVTPVVDHRREDRAGGLLRREGRQARPARRRARRRGDARARWSSRAPSTAPTASPSTSSRPASAPTPSTATSRRTPASARSPASRRARPACWSRPTSPRAASTSTASPTSSTSTCPNVPESLRAPHRPHRARRRSRHGDLVLRRRGAPATGATSSALIRQSIPVVEGHPYQSSTPAGAPGIPRPPQSQNRGRGDRGGSRGPRPGGGGGGGRRSGGGGGGGGRGGRS